MRPCSLSLWCPERDKHFEHRHLPQFFLWVESPLPLAISVISCKAYLAAWKFKECNVCSATMIKAAKLHRFLRRLGYWFIINAVSLILLSKEVPAVPFLPAKPAARHRIIHKNPLPFQSDIDLHALGTVAGKGGCRERKHIYAFPTIPIHDVIDTCR